MNKHILIVDDEADIRDLLAQALEADGFRVTSVATAAEALRAGQKDPPDLIISDLQLEDSDGLEMIARFKSIQPNLAVILLTGVLFEPAVAEELLQKTGACYVSKTSSLTRILETVRQQLDAGPATG